MSENTLTHSCSYCGHASSSRSEFYVVHPLSGLKCKSTGACERRQKRDQISAGRHFAPMINPIPVIQAFGLVNTLVAAIVAVCAIFMIATVYTCLAFLWGF